MNNIIMFNSRYEAWQFVGSLAPGRHVVSFDMNEAQTVRYCRQVAYEYSQAHRKRFPDVLRNAILVLTGVNAGELIIDVAEHERIEWGYRAYSERNYIRNLVSKAAPGAPLHIEGDKRTITIVRQVCAGKNLTVNATATGCVVSVNEQTPSKADTVRRAIMKAIEDGTSEIPVDRGRLAYTRVVISNEAKLLGVKVTTRWNSGVLLISSNNDQPVRSNRVDLDEMLKQYGTPEAVADEVRRRLQVGEVDNIL